MTDMDDLIAEARRLENDYGDNYEVMTHMSALADALEARQPSGDDREVLARLLAAQDGEEWDRLVGTAEYARNRYLRKSGAILDRMPSLSRATVPDAATEEAFKKAEVFDKAVALSERRQTLLEEAEAERDAALAAIERVRAIHFEDIAYADDSYGPEPRPDNYERHYCSEDGEDWPCPTIQALDEAPEPEWEYGLLNPQAPDGGKLQGGAHLITANREHILAQQRRGHPAILAVRRRKAGPWEPVEGEKP